MQAATSATALLDPEPSTRQAPVSYGTVRGTHSSVTRLATRGPAYLWRPVPYPGSSWLREVVKISLPDPIDERTPLIVAIGEYRAIGIF